MYTLIELPYAMEALEPVISAQTLSFHHGKHLQAYVDNLNKLLPGSEYEFIASFAPIHQYEPLVIISKHFKMPKKEIVREKHNIYQELFVQLIVGILILIVEYSVFAR